MSTEELEFRADDPVLGQVRDDLVSEEVRIDPLLNTRSGRVLFDDLPDTPRRAGPTGGKLR